MAYTLNTGHALYANLVELIGVQAGALVSHKTARTFTKHADATYGTGTYGEHFAALAGGYTAKGASFTPYLSLNTSTTPNYTVVAVLNSSGAVQGADTSHFMARAAGGDTIRSSGKDSSGNAVGYRVTGATIGTGPRMVTFCRIGETAAKLYNNTTLDVNSTGLGSEYNSPDARADYLCGWDGQNSITASLVWLAVFNKELSGAEISDLYASLGASNSFGLVVGSADTVSPTQTGTITISAITATSYTATWPAGADNVAVTGYEYRINAGSWVSVGNVLTTNITGRTPSSTDTFEVRAFDAAANKSTPALSTSVALAAVALGTITFPAVKDWSTGNLKLNESGVTVIVNNVTTGALVIKLTGKTTHATTGVCTVSDALIIAGTQYRATLILADGSEGTWKYSAT